MQSNYIGILQLGFVLSLLSRSEAEDVIGSGHYCLRSSPAEDRRTRVTFLREDTAGARSLYLTLWSAHMRLVTCEVNVNPFVIESYRSLCDRSNQEINQRYINVSMLLALDSSCTLNTSEQKVTKERRRGEEEEKKSRRKRSWIFPGTLWCGTGSKAVGYEQLGEHNEM